MIYKPLPLTAEEVRAALDYDPKTGLFFWRHRDDRSKQWNAAWAGKVAGSPNDKGYITTRIGEYKSLAAHRLAWLYFYGEWPDRDIDHINGKRDDNRIENLRLATRAENCRNYKFRRNNRSGITGVWFDTQRRKWASTITVGRKRVWRKFFDTAEEAHEARLKALEEHHGEFTTPNQLAPPPHGFRSV